MADGENKRLLLNLCQKLGLARHGNAIPAGILAAVQRFVRSFEKRLGSAAVIRKHRNAHGRRQATEWFVPVMDIEALDGLLEEFRPLARD